MKDPKELDWWNALSYRTTKSGRTYYIKVGSASAKPDSDIIHLKLDAFPLPNETGSAWIVLMPSKDSEKDGDGPNEADS
jgi:hypothetical protein